jgi:hypothetical protein
VIAFINLHSESQRFHHRLLLSLLNPKNHQQTQERFLVRMQALNVPIYIFIVAEYPQTQLTLILLPFKQVDGPYVMVDCRS